MPAFFNGQQLISPAVAARVIDAAMDSPGAAGGNTLCLIGPCTAGAPATVLTLSSPDDARAQLGSGDLVDAAVRAFGPSADSPGPAKVLAIRVNSATQSTLTLKDASAANVIVLTSADYGLATAQIKAKVEAATTTGSKLTVQLGSAYFSADNIGRASFAAQYTGGGASATMAIVPGVSCILSVAGSPVATIDLAVYTTVQQLVDRINTVAGFVATVGSGQGAAATAQLDAFASADVKTAQVTARSDLQAAVDWFNAVASPFVTAARAANAGAKPAVIPFTYLAGGTDGTTTNTEWTAAFAAAQLVDLQWLVPVSGSSAIHAMADAHSVYMTNVMRKRRRAFVGPVAGTTDAQAIAAAAALNSDRTAYTHLGMYDYNAAGALVLYPPYITAAMIAGAFAGLTPGVSMTAKSLRLRGIERNLRNPADTDALITGGVLCVEKTPTGYRVVKSVTTWLNDTKYNRVEVSTGAATDFVLTALEAALAPIKGSGVSPTTLGLAKSIAESTLRGLSDAKPAGLGVLVGDKASPPWKNLTVSGAGDTINVSVQISPVIPANYVLITAFAVPYTGLVTAA